jgi:hypothetical protein
MEFGLSDEQVWETARAVADRVPAGAEMDDWYEAGGSARGSDREGGLMLGNATL